ncbi:MAG: site-specific integrase [Sporolactobacillus sp.]
MGKEKMSFSDLTSAVEAYFIKCSFSGTRINTYRKGWKQIKQFMLNRSLEFYESKVADEFIQNIIGEGTYKELSRKQKDFIRCACVLTEYQTTGRVSYRCLSKIHHFEGEIGKVILDFLTDRKSRGMSKDTLASNRLYLHRFNDYLSSKGVLTISALNKQQILGYINSLGFYSKATIHCTLSSLRNFLRYLSAHHLPTDDLSYLVPKSSYKKENHLPTTYTQDEIEQMIQSIDRGNPKGKRDVVMILLATRLGLRASDICGLKFEHIHWETNQLQLVQKKTKEKLELPLLAEVGNALIDYLKYGRPFSDLPYVFIHARQPYEKLEEPTLHSIVSFYLKKAGIPVEQKKRGPHALRHSLAGLLLEKKTPISVISEVLGHASTESTKTYLRIDLETLRQCALEVNPLASFNQLEVH